MKTITPRHRRITTLLDVLTMVGFAVFCTVCGGVVIGMARMIGLAILLTLFVGFCWVLSAIVGFFLSFTEKLELPKVVEAKVDEIIPPSE